MDEIEELIDKEVSLKDTDNKPKDIKNNDNSLLISIEGIRDKTVFMNNLKDIQTTVVSKESVNKLVAVDLMSLDNDFFNGEVSVEEFTVVRSKTNYERVKNSIEKRLISEKTIVRNSYKDILESVKTISVNIDIIIHTASLISLTKSRKSNTINDVIKINPSVYTSGNNTSSKILNVNLDNYLESEAVGTRELNSAISDLYSYIYDKPELLKFVYAATSNNEYTSLELLEVLSDVSDVDLCHKLQIRDIVNLYAKSWAKDRLVRLHRYAGTLTKSLIDEIEGSLNYSFMDCIWYDISAITDYQNKLSKLTLVNNLSLDLVNLDKLSNRIFDSLSLVLGNFK